MVKFFFEQFLIIELVFFLHIWNSVYRIDPYVRLLISAYSWAKWMKLAIQSYFTHRIGSLVWGVLCMQPFVGIRKQSFHHMRGGSTGGQ
jgi:hypothetical protein